MHNKRYVEEIAFQSSMGTIRGLKWPASGKYQTAPRLLALHGHLDNAASFIPLANQLAETEIIALDLPGHGLSDHMPSPGFYQLHDYIQWLQLISDQVITDNTYLIGHSLGAILSGFWSLVEPRFRHLIWLDAVGGLPISDHEVADQWKTAMLSLKNYHDHLPVYRSVDEGIRARMNSAFPISSDSARILCERGMKPAGGGWIWSSAKSLRLPNPFRFSEQGIRHLLAEIQHPILIIMGESGWFNDKNDMHLQERLNCLRDYQCHVVSGGHHFHMDFNIAAADIIKHSLESIN